jgi:ATP:ADP antiporter, AAA family
MVSKIKQGFKSIFSSLLTIDKHERTKFYYLTAIYFFIIVGYTVSRELKYSIFTAIVGRSYLYHVNVLSMFFIVAPLYFYAKLVDNLRRYQVLCACCGFFGIVGLLFAFLLGHSTIGMANTEASGSRIFGWLFYLFVDSYVPFLVSVFWAFANSVTDQEAAKKNYGLMTAGSKIGGMLGALLSISILMFSSMALSPHMRDVFNHQALLAVASVMCLVAGAFVLLLMKKVPGHSLHGYEAAYKVEKERSKKGTSETGFLSGISMLLKVPYVFGIFGIVFFYEVINKILSFQRVYIAQSGSESVSDMSIFLYKTIFLMHLVGFFIASLGTRPLIEWLGERRALMLVPAIYAASLFYFMISYSTFAFVFVSTVTTALHYAFSYPLRESLYIPTVKEIKFKSKSWIDSFGSRFGRAASSGVAWSIDLLGAGLYFPAYLIFYAVISGAWFVVAYGLGKRYETAIANNEVIGVERLPEEEKKTLEQGINKEA